MMTRILIALALVSVLLSSCLGRKPVPEGASGAEIFVLQNCQLCHEADGSGSRRGPALGNLGAHWTQAELVDYFFDPAPAIAASTRLQEYEDKHSLSMPRYHNLTEEQRVELAGWVLTKFGS